VLGVGLHQVRACSIAGCGSAPVLGVGLHQCFSAPVLGVGFHSANCLSASELCVSQPSLHRCVVASHSDVA